MAIVASKPRCPGCVRLQAEVQRLRQQLDELRRQQTRQAHPFRRPHLPKRRRKPGRPLGHPPAVRPTPTPEQIDRVIDVPCSECPDCKTPLYDQNIVVQYQTDLPPIVPIVTQFNIETGRCPCCRQVCRGRHPEQISDAFGAAGNTIGPVALTMAAELKHRLGVPYRKIGDFFATYCDLRICSATLIRAEQRLAELARPSYDLLIEALRQADVVHADETGWRVERLNAWLWVFSNRDLTVYTIRTGPGARGSAVPLDILGPDFDGYLIVDGWAAYDVLECVKGRCIGHLLRRGKALRDTLPRREQAQLESFIALLQQALKLAKRRDQLTPAGYARRVQTIENRLDDWLAANLRRPTRSPELDKLDRHIRKHRGEWLVFLHDPLVPATNNHAERMLRPAVITRKVGGCNKTLLGALVHSILASLMVTCRQQGRKFLDFAKSLWHAGQPQPIPLVAIH